MKLRIEKSVIVITPTIGSPKLQKALASVQAQTYNNFIHLIVCDGADYYEPVNEQIKNFLLSVDNSREGKMQLMVLPFNTGKSGGSFYGHRIYSGVPHLLNADYIFFLDEDNWYEPDHISSLVDTLDQGNDFVYSLRKIYNANETYVCDDNCEALGKWPIYFTHNDPQYLVDTSSYAFKREFIEATCHLWHSGWGGDRRYLYSVMQRATFDTNGRHTLCYRLDGNPGSVNAEFFIKGNETQKQYYKDGFPWLKASI